MKFDSMFCLEIECWDIDQTHYQSEAGQNLLSKVSQAPEKEGGKCTIETGRQWLWSAARLQPAYQDRKRGPCR